MSASPSIVRDTNAQHTNPVRALRAWRVLHACDPAEQLFPLIEGELAIGMRPALVTPHGLVKPDALLATDYTEASEISLLNAWHEVRNWRKVLIESDPNGESDVVHAHCFTAGMAGVRNFPAVVYDVHRWIEDHAGGESEHTWLAHSFRVAEQFVLARAAAVVIRCQSMREAAVRRGTMPENIFVIPQAVEDPDPSDRDHAWLQSLGIDGARGTVLFAPDHRILLGADGKLAPQAEHLIAAFAIVASELENCHLLVQVDKHTSQDAHSALREATDAYRVGGGVHAIADTERNRAFASADIVIAGRAPQMGTSNQANPSAEAAFAARRALLAADLPCNRDLSATGRGCLWYAEDDPRDLAHRASFLARNLDFRRALADAGYGFFLETRSPIAVAQQYDVVYRHAFARRKSGGLQTPAVRLLPIQDAL